MPYLLLLIGLIIGVYALSRFFLKAQPEDIKALIMAFMTISVCLALFILSITGRLPAAIAIISALAPFIMAHYSARKRKKNGAQGAAAADTSKPMNREEALNVLGLAGQASEDEIKSAYKALMKKIHPDQQGSEWMAIKLNEARDTLLGKTKQP